MRTWRVPQEAQSVGYGVLELQRAASREEALIILTAALVQKNERALKRSKEKLLERAVIVCNSFSLKFGS